MKYTFLQQPRFFLFEIRMTKLKERSWKKFQRNISFICQHLQIPYHMPYLYIMNVLNYYIYVNSRVHLFHLTEHLIFQRLKLYKMNCDIFVKKIDHSLYEFNLRLNSANVVVCDAIHGMCWFLISRCANVNNNRPGAGLFL